MIRLSGNAEPVVPTEASAEQPATYQPAFSDDELDLPEPTSAAADDQPVHDPQTFPELAQNSLAAGSDSLGGSEATSTPGKTAASQEHAMGKCVPAAAMLYRAVPSCAVLRCAVLW